MRRSDREIKDISDIVSVIKKCAVCRLAINDGEFPYIVPLNFGVQYAGNAITLYFHGATEGKKIELIRKNNKVGFEMDCPHRLVADEAAEKFTMEYESVIGAGTIEFVENGKKREALNILMRHYAEGKTFEFDESVLSKTTVLKLTVQSVTGKRNIR